MDRLVMEKTNLLLDYIAKFINQTTAVSSSLEKSNITRTRRFGSRRTQECDLKAVDVEECLPYINYLEENAGRQLSGLAKVFETMENYFTKAKKKCENVLVNNKRCRKLVVSLIPS